LIKANEGLFDEIGGEKPERLDHAEDLMLQKLRNVQFEFEQNKERKNK
jgi:hypothetical protein